MDRRPLTIQVWDSRITLDSEGKRGPWTFMPVDVPLDEARELSDRLLYGPLVHARLSGGWCPRGFGPAVRVTHTYSVGVRAFIAEEAADALDEALPLLSGKLRDLHALPVLHTYRLRFGELCDHEVLAPGHVPNAA